MTDTLSDTFNSIIANADYFLLLLVRTGGLVLSSPVFGRTLMPNMVKIGFTAAMTYLFFTIFPPAPIPEYTTLFGYLLLIAAELVLGMALAFVTNLFFASTFIAGQLIDMQTGFGIVNMYDVQNNTQIPMMGNMFNTALLIIFFLADGHHQLLKMMYLTFEKLPVGNIHISAALGTVALELFAKMFLLGVMVALPVIASSLVLEICFGLLQRTVPQLNTFVVGIPIKMVVGFVVIAAVLPVFSVFSGRIFSEMFDGIEKMFATFAG